MSANGQSGDGGWFARGFPANKLSQHFHKHGKDFHCKSEPDYNNKAIAFMNSSGDGVESDSDNRNTVYKYNCDTNEFGIAKSDGTIITFFKPTTGEKYWIKQKEELEYDR